MERIIEFIMSFGAENYLIALVAVLIFTIIVQIRCNHVIKKYSEDFNSLGMTGEEAARAILEAYDIEDVDVVEGNGASSDSYNSRTKVITLSPEVFEGASVSAVGIAAHEAGHAIQYSRKYLPISIRSIFAPAARIGSKYSVLIIVIGLFISALAQRSPIGYYVALAGLIFFLFTVLFSILTLPVEFNASKRARKILAGDLGLVSEDVKGAKKVLSACAMTYVAALASSLITLLRMIAIVSRARRN